jgi:hypothetical protein
MSGIKTHQNTSNRDDNKNKTYRSRLKGAGLDLGVAETAGFSAELPFLMRVGGGESDRGESSRESSGELHRVNQRRMDRYSLEPWRGWLLYWIYTEILGRGRYSLLD